MNELWRRIGTRVLPAWQHTTSLLLPLAGGSNHPTSVLDHPQLEFSWTFHCWPSNALVLLWNFHICAQESFHWSQWGWNPLLSSKAFHTGIPPRSDVWMFDILTFTFRCLSMAQEHPLPFLASSWMNGYLTLYIHDLFVFWVFQNSSLCLPFVIKKRI